MAGEAERSWSSLWSRPIWTQPLQLIPSGQQVFRRGAPHPTAQSSRLGATVMTHTPPRGSRGAWGN